jgi:TolB-like protein/DNA-binding winged helix-turn-helix (wHTH) protein/Flp pilus assembly protein TadD
MATPARIRQTFQFGDFEADPSSGELRRHGHKLKLPDQSFHILSLLLARPGEVVTREELQRELWAEDTFVDFEAGLNSAIKRLRDALGDSADNPRFVETLPRRGYRFIAGVEEVQEPHPVAVPGAGGAPAASAGPGRLRLRKWVIALGLVAAGGLLFALNVGGLRQRLWPGRTSAHVRSLVVLPLENLSGDPAQEYFADGMTDELTTSLAQISSLRVISRTSAMQYKGKRKPLAEIARELQVDAVVEGSVVRSGERVRVTAQLIDVATDEHLWAQSYERDLRNVVSLQDEITRAIVGEIRAKLTPQEQARLASARPVNPDAYEDYLKGRYYSGKWTGEGWQKAAEYFQQAIEKQPDYAQAWAGLSLSYLQLSYRGLGQSSELMARAEAAAKRALELNDSLSDAHAALAVVRFRRHWDWAGAEAEYKRAWELEPNSPWRWRYTVFLRTTGRYQEAIAEARRVSEFDPFSADRSWSLGAALVIARQYDPAIAELRRAAALNPEQALVHQFLAMAYEQRKQLPEAVSEAELSVGLSHRDPSYLGVLGHAYALSGRRREAAEILAELRRHPKQVPAYQVALVWIGLNNRQAAMAWLERSYQEHDFQIPTINSFPWWDPLRSDPRFQNLVRRMGLDPQKAIPR